MSYQLNRTGKITAHDIFSAAVEITVKCTGVSKAIDELPNIVDALIAEARKIQKVSAEDGIVQRFS